MNPQVTQKSSGATFKVAGNPYKGVASDVKKMIEENKLMGTKPEKMCPTIEQAMWNLGTYALQNRLVHHPQNQ